MDRVQKRSVQLVWHIVVLVIVLLLLNMVAAGMFMRIESMTFTDAFYLSMSATSTAGYGNVATETVPGKWFISFFQTFAYGLYMYIISVMCTSLTNRRFDGPIYM